MTYIVVLDPLDAFRSLIKDTDHLDETVIVLGDLLTRVDLECFDGSLKNRDMRLQTQAT